MLILYLASNTPYSPPCLLYPTWVSRLIYSLTYNQLNDNWDYAPDSNLAWEIFTDILGVSPSRSSTPSSLCHRCSELELWSPSCSFQDSQLGLKDKATGESCALCRLLFKCIRTRVEKDSDPVRFSRAGSYLTLENQKQPLANLYTTSCMYQGPVSAFYESS